jgi:hypothetical protein
VRPGHSSQRAVVALVAAASVVLLAAPAGPTATSSLIKRAKVVDRLTLRAAGNSGLLSGQVHRPVRITVSSVGKRRARITGGWSIACSKEGAAPRIKKGKFSRRVPTTIELTLPFRRPKFCVVEAPVYLRSRGPVTVKLLST